MCWIYILICKISNIGKVFTSDEVYVIRNMAKQLITIKKEIINSESKQNSINNTATMDGSTQVV